MTTADTGPIPDPFRIESMNALLARNWWAIALRGALGVAFGLIALFEPGAALLSLVLVYAAYMLADGVLNLIAGLRSAQHHERWGMLVFQGIVSLLAAAGAVFLPGLTAIVFVYLFAAWSIVSGGFAVAAAARVRGDHGRWWMGLGGVLSIVVGVLLAIAPLIGALVLTWWIGAYAVVFGVSLLVLAVRLRSHRASASHAATPHPA